MVDEKKIRRHCQNCNAEVELEQDKVLELLPKDKVDEVKLIVYCEKCREQGFGMSPETYTELLKQCWQITFAMNELPLEVLVKMARGNQIELYKDGKIRDQDVKMFNALLGVKTFVHRLAGFESRKKQQKKIIVPNFMKRK